MSLEELAIATGSVVTKQAMSKYERGLMLPSPGVLTALARLYGVKAAELLAAPSVEVQVLAFRRMSRLSKRERLRVEGLVSRMLEQRVRLQEAAGARNGSDVPLGMYAPSTLEECEEIASKVRASWSLGTDPIACVTDVLEEHAVHVLELESENALDGLAAVARDEHGSLKAAAVLSRKGVAGERQRLNLAHELGHLVMRETAEVDPEKAAFRFGAAFLAPAASVRRDVGGARRRVALGELLLLKRRYGMSVQALVYRLRDLEIIGANQATALWKQISARGWKKEEPGALDAEKPQWSRRAAFRAIAEGTLTIDEAQGMFATSACETGDPEPTATRELMKLPIAMRTQQLRADAERARDHYVMDDEWASILGADLLPDE
jgi:Zn-dependent peptidase ImmA (M78 family)